MRLWALLLFCGLCLGQTTQDHNDQPGSSSPTEDWYVWAVIAVDAPDRWSLSVGDSVTIRCYVFTDLDQDKAKQLSLKLKQRTQGAIQIVATEPASRQISYTLGPVTLQDRGLYSCEVDQTHPHITVEDAHKFIWVNDSSAAVSLQLLTVNRIKYFYDQTFTIGCEVPDDEAKWRIMRASEKTGEITECPNQEQSGNLLSCTIPSLPFPISKSRRYDPFWCESSTGQTSNVLNMTETEITERNSRDYLVTKFKVGPSWFVREGDSVNIECKVRVDKGNHSDKFDLQLIWTKRNLENTMTVLLNQRASKPINYTLNNITHEHSGVYSCWDDGTLPIHVFPEHHFIWVQDDSPPVTIDVLSHNRTMFLENEDMTVGCQLPDDQSQWKIKSFDKWTGVVKDCEAQESTSRLLSCSRRMGYPLSDYLFWCESTTGLRSNVLNVTNTIGFSLLEAPPLPVMEGDDLTLRCLRMNRTTKKFTAPPSAFMHNDRNFAWSDDGSVMIKNVTKENEGLYNCRVEDDVNTLESYVTVKARPQEQKKTRD